MYDILVGDYILDPIWEYITHVYQKQKIVMIFRTLPSMGVRGQVLVAGWDKLTYLAPHRPHTPGVSNRSKYRGLHVTVVTYT